MGPAFIVIDKAIEDMKMGTLEKTRRRGELRMEP
jgi:hypothetical protein